MSEANQKSTHNNASQGPINTSKNKSSKIEWLPQKKGVIYDKVHPSDFMNLNLIYACEHCSHFDEPNQHCTIGYSAKMHLKKVQDHMYELSGRMAFCRFAEID